MNLLQFFKDLADGGGPVPWETWLPVSLQAMSFQECASAWNSLTDDERDKAAERLYHDGSVFADVFRQLVARHVASLDGDQGSKRTWLDDGAEATRRTVQRLKEQEGALRALVKTTEEPQLELIIQMAEMEAALARFRDSHVEDDYGKMIEFQTRIAELTRKEQELVGFDKQAAELRRQELTHEVGVLLRDKVELEHTLRALDAELAQAQLDKEALNADVAEKRLRIEEIQREVKILTGEQAELDHQVSKEVAQQRAMAKEIKEKRRAQQEAVNALKRDQVILKELEGSPLSQEALRLDRELDDLFQKFDADSADVKLSASRRYPEEGK